MIINPGASEKSAYQYAVDGGYTGTEAEFQALMGSGPWLPVSGGTVKGDIVFAKNGYGINTFKPREVSEVSGGNLSYVNGWGFDGLILTGILHMANYRIAGLGVPVNNADAATKYYVDQKADSIKTELKDSANKDSTNSVKTHKFTVQGPIAAGATFDLTFSGLESSPFSGDTIFFGPEIDFVFTGGQHKKYQFEQINYTPGMGYEDGKQTYDGIINMKALTEIPEGTSVDILLVWI